MANFEYDWSGSSGAAEEVNTWNLPVPTPLVVAEIPDALPGRLQ